VKVVQVSSLKKVADYLNFLRKSLRSPHLCSFFSKITGEFDFFCATAPLTEKLPVVIIFSCENSHELHKSHEKLVEFVSFVAKFSFMVVSSAHVNSCEKNAPQRAQRRSKSAKFIGFRAIRGFFQ